MDYEDSGIWVDGEHATIDDMTYREQREMRELVRELAPDGDLGDGGEIDYIPAMICVIRRRKDPAFTLEQALEVRPNDVGPPVPPTKPAARKK